MRIHGDVTNDTAKAMSDIKNLLVKNFGTKYNDTGLVIGYCVSCTVQVLNEHYTIQQNELKKLSEEMKDDKIQVDTRTPADVQDKPVVGGGPEGDNVDNSVAGETSSGASGIVD